MSASSALSVRTAGYFVRSIGAVSPSGTAPGVPALRRFACGLARGAGTARRRGEFLVAVKALTSSMPSSSATRRVSVLNSSARKKPISALASGSTTRHSLKRHRHGRVRLELDELTGELRHIGVRGEIFAAFGLLDLIEMRKKLVQAAEGRDELGRRLDADAGDTGNIVRRIAGERLDLDDLVRRHAEALFDLGLTDGLALHGIEHFDAGAHELHQVLVRRDNRHLGPGIGRIPGIGCDEIVGLVAGKLDGGHVEGADGVPHQRELRHEILGWWRAVRLVVLVDVVAKSLFGRIEDHRDMRRPLRALRLAQELVEHGAEAVQRACGQPVRFARKRRQRVICAEDVARAVNKIDVVALRDPRGLCVCAFGCGLFCHQASEAFVAV